MPNVLDNPLILSFLFHPRDARAGSSRLRNVTDGLIPVGDGVSIGYRLFAHKADSPVIVYFHGNGEVAGDYDDSAPLYALAGASLLVMDYRGYGWSTGKPLVSTLLPDAESAWSAIPGILGQAGLRGPLVIMGRSLGSAPAIHLAHLHQDKAAGLIIESGFAQVIPLLVRLGLPAMLLHEDPINNLEKIASLTIPLLVIHGEQDALIPVSEGQKLHDSAASASKLIRRFRGAGHNDLMYYAEEYFAAIEGFLKPFTTA